MTILEWISVFGISAGVLFGVLSYVLGLSNLLSIIANAFSIATPALRGIVEGIVDWLRNAVSGFKVAMANPSVWVLVLSLCGASAGGTWYYEHKKIDALKEANAKQIELTNKWYKAYWGLKRGFSR